MLLLGTKERSDLAALGKSKTITTHVAPNETREELGPNREEKRRKRGKKQRGYA